MLQEMRYGYEVSDMRGLRGGDTGRSDVAAGKRKARRGASRLRNVCDGAEPGVGAEADERFHGDVDFRTGERSAGAGFLYM